MGRKLANPTPTVINTKFVSLDESFFIAADGQTEQWYYDNEAKYAPNRHLTPLTLTPKLSVKDKDTNISYSVDAGTVSFYTVTWYALEYTNGGYVETAITNLTDSSDADYVLSGFNLIVKKNVSYSHGVTIRCLATYKDPRDANTTCTTQGTVLLTTNRDAKVELPEVTIISPSARAFNPLTDYKTVDGVEVQDSLFDFEATVSNKPTGDSVIQYRVDGGGTEELVEEDGVMTALPSMDIRYPDSGVMLDQSFLYRITANGTKPNINGGAFVTALRGNTVKWNQLMPEDKRSASKSYSADATYYVNIITGLSVTVTESHKYYMSAYVTRNISGNDGFYIFLLQNNTTTTGNISVANGSENGLKSAIWNATSSFVCGMLRVSNYRFKRGFSAGDSFSFSNYTFIDLTTMFGTDDQIAAALGITTDDITTETGVAAFEAWLETNLGKRDYYPYDAGSLVPTRFSAVKSTGFNVWDEEWEQGAINSTTGENTTGNAIRSKNYIPVFAKSYYLKAGNLSDEGVRVFYYDAEKKHISNMIWAGTINTIPDDVCFIRFHAAHSLYGSTYNNDICINLSTPSRNGTYEAYWESSVPLAISSITGKLNGEGESVTVFPDGMKHVGDVYDEIKVENGVLKAIKRVGVVDLGTLTWNYSPTTEVFINRTFQRITSKCICSKYDTRFSTSSTSWGYDKTLYYGHKSSTIVIKDSSAGTDAAAFKTAMSGVILHYALTTPQEYVLDPIQDPFIFEWFGISGNQEVKADTLPWYVSGQGTSRLTVDAMFGEHINVVAAAKTISGQLSPSRAYAAVTWRIPDVDTHVMSAKGGTVRNESDSFTFETICNVKGQMLSENVKNEHLRFNWKWRRSDSTTENDAGWGQSVTVPSASLLNVRTVAGKLPSTHVYPYPFLLGAWEVQTSTDPVPYAQPTTTKDGVTYVRTIN